MSTEISAAFTPAEAGNTRNSPSGSSVDINSLSTPSPFTGSSSLQMSHEEVLASSRAHSARSSSSIFGSEPNGLLLETEITPNGLFAIATRSQSERILQHGSLFSPLKLPRRPTKAPSSPYKSPTDKSPTVRVRHDSSETNSKKGIHSMSAASASRAKAKARNALKLNDSMVYLDGPRVYGCSQCRTHFTTQDDILSKSFHGRNGRAYLFDQCVNISIGPPEDRVLMTGLHKVCDIFCKRCNGMVGWTYTRAYEPSQKYKEGKFIIEKINLYLEESPHYNFSPPVGERRDRWKRRSMNWGDEPCRTGHHMSGTSVREDAVYEYHLPTRNSLPFDR